jgi:hypothetical protein
VSRVKSQTLSSHASLIVAVAVFSIFSTGGAAVLTGCSAPRTTSSASITAAEVSTTTTPATPPNDDAPAAAAEAEEFPGQLVCRTKSLTDGTAELFLDWKGATAMGTLRRVAPSGMIYVQRVQAERAGTLIVADATCGETDLVTHTAMITQQNGKQLMRLGDGNRPWSACE